MTFLYPLFLLGVTLTVIPIIIHLWFQKKLKKIPFSTLKFLKRSEAKRFGWLRFREILILILRCLFIAFLFLSLAKPQVKKKLFGAGRLASVFLIIDNSYSMAYGENFRLIKRTADELISLYSSKSEFLVVPLCKTEFEDTTSYRSWVSKQSASELIKRINISYKKGNINNALSQWSTGSPQHTVEYVYIGDGQETNFIDFTEAMIEQRDFYWLQIPLGSNVGITKVALEDPISIPLDNYSLRVTMTNFSSKNWKGTATVRAGDHYYEKDCEIQPNSELSVEFLLPTTIQNGTIVLYDDSLITDNVYYFSKSLPRKLNVVIVGSDKFLYAGLNPTDEVHSPFSIEATESLGKVDLRRFNVVILNGINDISESDRIKLDNFMNQTDKSIICFLGDTVGKNLKEFVSRCCDIEQSISPKGYVTLDWVDYTNPIFNIFVGSTTLKNIKFYHFQKMNAQKGIIAKVTGNYPLIIVDNNFAVIATQFSPRATDIVYKAAFVPLLFRLIISTTYKSYENEFYIGEIVYTFGKLRAPTGEYITKGKEFLTPGFYTIDSETIGVNVIPEEGNPKILGDEAAKILNVQTIDAKDNLAKGDLSDIFLYLALCALFLEVGLLLMV